MVKIFLTVLNMSLTASVVILAVILVRLLLKRSPRIFSYLLWLVVLIRLICPLVPETDFGIIPEIRIESSAQMNDGGGIYRLQDAGREASDIQSAPSDETLSSGRINSPHMENGETEGRQDSLLTDTHAQNLPALQNPDNSGMNLGVKLWQRMEDAAGSISQTVWRILTALWLTGFLGMCLYSIISYQQLKKKLNALQLSAEESAGKQKIPVIISEHIDEPFTMGFFHPVIHLPARLDAVKRKLVEAHEMVHIKRRDHLIKPFAFFVLSIHWFNPFAWFAFRLMEEDMETSCDEAVLKQAGYEQNKIYAKTLLSVSANRIGGLGCPIAFGGSYMKTRIKNALTKKKAGLWICLLSGCLIVVVAVILLVNNGAQTADRENAQAADQENDLADGTENSDVQTAGGEMDQLRARADELARVLEQARADVETAEARMAEMRIEDEGNAIEVERLEAAVLEEERAVLTAEIESNADFLAVLQTNEDALARYIQMLESAVDDADARAALGLSEEELSQSLRMTELERARLAASIEETESKIAGLQARLEVLNAEENSLASGGVTVEGSDQSVQVEVLALPDGEVIRVLNGNGDAQQLLPEGFEIEVPVILLCSYPVADPRISNAFGSRVHPATGETVSHDGVDFAAEEGTAVMAAADGVVYETGFNADDGYYVIIQHENGELTHYNHCKEILVETGDSVSRGGQIATVGNTGRSTGAHLHFAVEQNGVYTAPVFRTEN